MQELSLSQIKQTELEILRQFDAFCRQHNIRYFLSNGTLLGAVKYKGFIPWDDDIDLLVPREDYNRLMREFSSDGNLKLLCQERDSNYVFPYAKLSDINTTIANQTILKDYQCGVHIDIFPLDGWNDDLAKAQKTACKLRNSCQNLCMSFSKFSKGRSLLRTVVKSVWIALARLKGCSSFRARLARELKKALNEAGDKTCGCVVWPIYGEGEIHSADVFADTVFLEFEGAKFPAPIGYDAYLRGLYGDYEKDPPPNKQKSHHSFIAYRNE